MAQAHEEAYDFMPPSFVLPDETDFYEEYLQDQLADGATTLWILKPAKLMRGSGIFLHRVSAQETRTPRRDKVLPSLVCGAPLLVPVTHHSATWLH